MIEATLILVVGWTLLMAILVLVGSSVEWDDDPETNSGEHESDSIEECPCSTCACDR